MRKGRSEKTAGITLLEPFDSTRNEELSAMADDLSNASFFILRRRLSFSATEDREVLNVIDSLLSVREFILQTQKKELQ